MRSLCYMLIQCSIFLLLLYEVRSVERNEMKNADSSSGVPSTPQNSSHFENKTNWKDRPGLQDMTNPYFKRLENENIQFDGTPVPIRFNSKHHHVRQLHQYKGIKPKAKRKRQTYRPRYGTYNSEIIFQRRIMDHRMGFGHLFRKFNSMLPNQARFSIFFDELFRQKNLETTVNHNVPGSLFIGIQNKKNSKYLGEGTSPQLDPKSRIPSSKIQTSYEKSENDTSTRSKIDDDYVTNLDKFDDSMSKTYNMNDSKDIQNASFSFQGASNLINYRNNPGNLINYTVSNYNASGSDDLNTSTNTSPYTEYLKNTSFGFDKNTERNEKNTTAEIALSSKDFENISVISHQTAINMISNSEIDDFVKGDEYELNNNISHIQTTDSEEIGSSKYVDFRKSNGTELAYQTETASSSPVNTTDSTFSIHKLIEKYYISFDNSSKKDIDYELYVAFPTVKSNESNPIDRITLGKTTLDNQLKLTTINFDTSISRFQNRDKTTGSEVLENNEVFGIMSITNNVSMENAKNNNILNTNENTSLAYKTSRTTDIVLKTATLKENENLHYIESTVSAHGKDSQKMKGDMMSILGVSSLDLQSTDMSIGSEHQSVSKTDMETLNTDDSDNSFLQSTTTSLLNGNICPSLNDKITNTFLTKLLFGQSNTNVPDIADETDCNEQRPTYSFRTDLSSPKDEEYGKYLSGLESRINETGKFSNNSRENAITSYVTQWAIYSFNNSETRVTESPEFSDAGTMNDAGQNMAKMSTLLEEKSEILHKNNRINKVGGIETAKNLGNGKSMDKTKVHNAEEAGIDIVNMAPSSSRDYSSNEKEAGGTLDQESLPTIDTGNTDAIPTTSQSKIILKYPKESDKPSNKIKKTEFRKTPDERQQKYIIKRIPIIDNNTGLITYYELNVSKHEFSEQRNHFEENERYRFGRSKRSPSLQIASNFRDYIPNSGVIYGSPHFTYKPGSYYRSDINKYKTSKFKKNYLEQYKSTDSTENNDNSKSYIKGGKQTGINSMNINFNYYPKIAEISKIREEYKSIAGTENNDNSKSYIKGGRQTGIYGMIMNRRPKMSETSEFKKNSLEQYKSTDSTENNDNSKSYIKGGKLTGINSMNINFNYYSKISDISKIREQRKSIDGTKNNDNSKSYIKGGRQTGINSMNINLNYYPKISDISKIREQRKSIHGIENNDNSKSYIKGGRQTGINSMNINFNYYSKISDVSKIREQRKSIDGTKNNNNSKSYIKGGRQTGINSMNINLNYYSKISEISKIREQRKSIDGIENNENSKSYIKGGKQTGINSMNINFNYYPKISEISKFREQRKSIDGIENNDNSKSYIKGGRQTWKFGMPMYLNRRPKMSETSEVKKNSLEQYKSTDGTVNNSNSKSYIKGGRQTGINSMNINFNYYPKISEISKIREQYKSIDGIENNDNLKSYIKGGRQTGIYGMTMYLNRRPKMSETSEVKKNSLGQYKSNDGSENNSNLKSYIKGGRQIGIYGMVMYSNHHSKTSLFWD